MDIANIDTKLHQLIEGATATYTELLNGEITLQEYKRRKGIAVQMLAEELCDDDEQLIDEAE